MGNWPNDSISRPLAKVGIESSGIIVYTRQSQLKLKWGQIAEFRYRENKFTIVTKTREKTLILSAETTQKARSLFQCMSETHQFYRPESKGKRSRLLPRLPHVIPIIKSTFTTASPSPKVEEDEEDKKQRRKSAPPPNNSLQVRNNV